MNTIWDIIKQNIFTIVIIVTLIIAMPWLGYLFLIPLALIFVFGAMLAWKVHKLRSQIYKEAEQQQQRGEQHGWWQRSRTREEERLLHRRIQGRIPYQDWDVRQGL